MAKPKNTVYMICNRRYNDFGFERSSPIAFDGLRISVRCGRTHFDTIEATNTRTNSGIRLVDQAQATLFFGHQAAKTALYHAVIRGKKYFEKGRRPHFYLRKVTETDLMEHELWPKLKETTWAKTHEWGRIRAY